MRSLTVLSVTLVLCCAAFAQRPAGYAYGYGSGPYIPLVTTPQVVLQQVSPNPVGATNATSGLIAGARNSTLSMINGNTSSTYTEAVWYHGGDAPLISEPEISLVPRPIHGGHVVRREMRYEQPREGAETEHRQWTFIASLPETVTPVEASTAAKTAKHAARTITNQDIDQENQKTGMVKYDGKNEKIQ